MIKPGVPCEDIIADYVSGHSKGDGVTFFISTQCDSFKITPNLAQ